VSLVGGLSLSWFFPDVRRAARFLQKLRRTHQDQIAEIRDGKAVPKSGAAYSGAVEVAPGVWVYQMTKNGLALQLTLQGTKYYTDDDLNK
jgi:hypothetical protein